LGLLGLDLLPDPGEFLLDQALGEFEEEGTTEEAARADYRRIAERRVRLGLVLAEVGQAANVQVTDDEVTQALLERARQFPGQEKAVWDYYRKTPEAMAQLRAPVFEEKVVDHIVAKANVTERVVSKDELFKIDADDEKSAA
ncbi:MAG: trigger factor, partial [Hyphomicrobiales bacterium]|nr:trigger factor [Hyphomicrobiales bacterium]